MAVCIESASVKRGRTRRTTGDDSQRLAGEETTTGGKARRVPAQWQREPGLEALALVVAGDGPKQERRGERLLG